MIHLSLSFIDIYRVTYNKLLLIFNQVLVEARNQLKEYGTMLSNMLKSKLRKESGIW